MNQEEIDKLPRQSGSELDERFEPTVLALEARKGWIHTGAWFCEGFDFFFANNDLS
jgi:hypothetical protein